MVGGNTRKTLSWVIPMQRYFTDLANAFVRGRLGQPDATVEDGLKAGLRLHKFKVNSELPRVQRILGILRGLVGLCWRRSLNFPSHLSIRARGGQPMWRPSEREGSAG
jgi:hypothetical protein